MKIRVARGRGCGKPMSASSTTTAANAAERVFNENIGVLGHVDSGKTSLGVAALAARKEVFRDYTANNKFNDRWGGRAIAPRRAARRVARRGAPVHAGGRAAQRARQLPPESHAADV